MKTQNMKMTKAHFSVLFLAALALVFSSCDRNALTGSKLTPANYDQVTTGMSKAQVEKILGPPTTMETKDMIIFKKTTYRYEDRKRFAIITFKNDELDSKDTNMGREP
jgi:outer membrane protein assembly factor BamE (lipoprotein component of BamABCDE complex)